MRINYIELEGFKLFKEKMRIDLHKKTLIKADNFQGKTSIAEAIAYGFCGVSLNGESRNIEDLINHDSKDLRIEINFNDDNDRNHTLIRIKDRKNQYVYLDNEEEPTTQTAINAFIGDNKLFLSCFNLGYFQQELEDSERRNLIVQYAPAIDMTKLFGELSDKALIEKYNIETHKTSEYSRLNKLKSQTDEAIKEIEIKLNVLSEQNEADSNVAAEYVAIDEEIEKNLKEQIEKVHEMRLYNSQVQSEYDQYNQKVLEYNANVERVKILQEALDKCNNVNLIPKYHKDTESFKQKGIELITLQQEVINLSTEKVCRLCGNEISDDKMQSNALKKAETEQKIINLQNEINNMYEEDKKNETFYQELQNKKNKIEAEYNILIKTIENVPSPPEKGIYDLSDYDAIQEKYDKIVLENNQKRIKNSDIANKINSINARIEEINKLNTHKNLLIAQSTELASALTALSPSSGIFRKALEIKSNFIKSELDNCSIILEKIQKNGEVKECFEIYFKNTPYRRLSYSEQMTCSLEIAKFLRNQSRKNIPIFVDNSESISKIDKNLLEGDQQIYCLVQEGQTLEISAI